MLDILDYEGGSQPPKKEFIYEPRKGYVRLLQIRDFGDKPFPTYVPDSKRLKKATREDLLLARYGGSSANDSLGRICTGLDGAYNVALAKLILSHEIVEKDYVRYLFLGPWFREKVSQNSRSCQTGFNREDVQDIEFPIAPLTEQHRIVAKLEEVLSRMTACQQRLARVPALLKRFRQSVLDAACSGRLTMDWRELHTNIESTDNLITRVRAIRRAEWEAIELAKTRRLNGGTPKDRTWKDKYVEPPDPDPSVENAPELPDTWSFTGIDVLLSTIRRGMKTGPFGSSLKKAEHQASGIPVLGIENIGEMTFKGGTKIHVSKAKAIELAEFDALPGDILISRSGTVGEVCVVPEGLGEARISTNIMRVTLRDDGMLPTYFSYLFNGSAFVLHQVERLCGGSTRDFLNQEILRSIVFPLPPLKEQAEIVRRVEKLFVLADQIEMRFAEAKKRVDSITQSILAKAFSGELVPTEHELAKAEGRSFESAEEMLKRIKGDGQGKTGGKGRAVRRSKHSVAVP